jgi:ectoine hydroxylase-related dioxygenase (phytanoyl-CoA dioxygenase family)
METVMPQPLTDEQLGAFRRDGFLHIPGLVPADELKAMQDESAAMIQKGIDGPFGDESYQYGRDAQDADKQCLFRINGLIRQHNMRSAKLLLAYPKLLEAISQACDGDHFVSQVHSLVFKIPHRGYPVPWHQDPVPVYRWPVFNVDVYLDEATTDNGCLYAIPGSHLAGYHGKPDFIRAWTKGKEHDAPGAVAVPTKPGDVVFHATSVLHGSFWNRAKSMRRTCYFHINHLSDVLMRPKDDGHRIEYLDAQRILVDALAERAKAKPGETPFAYKPIDASVLA